MRQAPWICVLCCVAVLTRLPSYADEKTPKLVVLEKFPQDYVGKSFKEPVWLFPDGIEKINDDLYAIMFRDGTVADPRKAPNIGLSSLLLRDKLNFVLAKDQAKTLVEELKPETYTKYQLEFAISKVKMADTDYYLAKIKSVKRLK